MKKLFFALLLISSASFAAGEFDYNNAVEENAFAELSDLEKFVEANPNQSITSIKNNHSELVERINLEENTSATLTAFTEEMPLVGGFWWGCCLGIVGLALVYFITDNDKEQVKSALIGCVITTILIGVGGIINPFGWF